VRRNWHPSLLHCLQDPFMNPAASDLSRPSRTVSLPLYLIHRRSIHHRLLSFHPSIATLTSIHCRQHLVNVLKIVWIVARSNMDTRPRTLIHHGHRLRWKVKIQQRRGTKGRGYENGLLHCSIPLCQRRNGRKCPARALGTRVEFHRWLLERVGMRKMNG